MSFYFNNQIDIKDIDNPYIIGYEIYGITQVNNKNVEVLLGAVDKDKLDFESVILYIDKRYFDYRLKPVYRKDYRPNKHNPLI